jgi:hypothetical protein
VRPSEAEANLLFKRLGPRAKPRAAIQTTAQMMK